MRDFMRAKVAAEGGDTAQVDVLRHGGKRTEGGVTIAVVRGDHSNGVPRGLLDSDLADVLAPDRLTAYVGPENGYVLTLSNGLAIYLSGDTGHTSDMATIVNGFYGAKVAILNCGDIFSMGPEECAFAVNVLIEPKTAIASHMNEEATKKGKVIGGTRTQTFIDEVDRAKVIVPRSGVQIKCDKDGNCKQGK